MCNIGCTEWQFRPCGEGDRGAVLASGGGGVVKSIKSMPNLDPRSSRCDSLSTLLRMTCPGNAVKTFFSSLLIVFATLFAAPAYADDACKNLFDVSSVPVTYWNIDGNTITNAIGTGRTTVSLHIQIQESSGVRVVSDTQAIAGKRSLRFTLGNDATKIYIKFNGKDADLILKPWTDITDTKFEAGETYVMSYDVLSADASVVGGFQIKNVQIEQGSTATSYVPYNPLCATCDGTIVNYTTVTENKVPAGVQNGTPSPDNPIEPVFYKQGDMVLRKVGNYADSYDATTGKITRRVGMKVLDGTETFWSIPASNQRSIPKSAIGYPASGVNALICSHYPVGSSTIQNTYYIGGSYINFIVGETYTTMDAWKNYLAQQYAAGTPVTVYYPLETETTEDIGTTYCAPNIKIATTAYNAARFNPVKTDLNSAVATIREIVTKTINQTAAIASLQADKQTRPEDACPAGCLLVETEENGVIVPHWFPIIEAPTD